MTDEKIMELPQDTLVQLWVTRWDDVIAAKKEAYKIHRAEQNRVWNIKHSEFRKAQHRLWVEKNREHVRQYLKDYRKRKSLEKASAGTETVAEAGPHTTVTTEPLHIPTPPKASAEPEGSGSTDRQKLAYWNAVLEDLDRKFAAKEIDVETYINQSNIAASHVLAAESRMKKSKQKGTYYED